MQALEYGLRCPINSSVLTILIYFECTFRVVCKWRCTHKYSHVSKGRKIKVKATAKKGRKKRAKPEHSVCCCGQKHTCIHVLRLRLNQVACSDHTLINRTEKCAFQIVHTVHICISMWYNNKIYLHAR